MFYKRSFQWVMPGVQNVTGLVINGRHFNATQLFSSLCSGKEKQFKKSSIEQSFVPGASCPQLSDSFNDMELDSENAKDSKHHKSLEKNRSHLCSTTRIVNHIALSNSVSWDVHSDAPDDLCILFSALSECGYVSEALRLLTDVVAGERTDILARIRHKPFLTSTRVRKKMEEALAFLRILPSEYIDKKTCNMVLSVCVAKRSLQGGLEVMNRLREACIKPDLITYTNMITIAAQCRDADGAFKIFKQMKDEDINPCTKAYTAVISSCSQEIIKHSVTKHRRRQLVLLERAFSLVKDMQKSRIKPDLVVYNVLLSACGRAGEIYRFQDVFRQLESKGWTADATTYGTLVRYLTKRCYHNEAIEVYERALVEGKTASVKLFRWAIQACSNFGSRGPNMIYPIWEKARSQHFHLNSELLGALIHVAERAGKIHFVVCALKEMSKNGIRPSLSLLCHLIQASAQSGETEIGFQLLTGISKKYESSKSVLKDSQILIGSANILIGCYAREASLEGALKVLQIVMKMGLKPNEVTYMGLFNACSKCKEGELAVSLYDSLHRRGVKKDYFLVKSLLMVCRQQRQLIRAGLKDREWVVGRNPVGTEILNLLDHNQKSSVSQSNWIDFTFRVYREALQSGIEPSVNLLNLTVSSLRKAAPSASRFRDTTDDEYWIQKALRTRRNDYLGYKNAAENLEGTSPILIALEYDAEGSWDPRTFQLIEESITIGLLAPLRISCSGSQTLDFRAIPPQLSESYLLYVLEKIRQYTLEDRRKSNLQTTFTLLVHPFNPNAVLTVSGHVTPIPNKVSYPIAEFERGAAQGLGIAAMLRRVRLHHITFAEEGEIVLEHQALRSWIFTTMRKAAHEIRDITISMDFASRKP